MDPKTLPNLDPKLREVYDRVMKMPITPSNSSQNTQVPQPQPNQPPQATPPTSNSEPSTVPLVKPSTTPPSPVVQDTLHSTQVFNPDASKTTASPANDAKGKGKISPVIWVIGGIVLLTVYAIFWVSFFKISFPF